MSSNGQPHIEQYTIVRPISGRLSNAVGFDWKGYGQLDEIVRVMRIGSYMKYMDSESRQ